MLGRLVVLYLPAEHGDTACYPVRTGTRPAVVFAREFALLAMQEYTVDPGPSEEKKQPSVPGLGAGFEIQRFRSTRGVDLPGGESLPAKRAGLGLLLYWTVPVELGAPPCFLFVFSMGPGMPGITGADR